MTFKSLLEHGDVDKSRVFICGADLWSQMTHWAGAFTTLDTVFTSFAPFSWSVFFDILPNFTICHRIRPIVEVVTSYYDLQAPTLVTNPWSAVQSTEAREEKLDQNFSELFRREIIIKYIKTFCVSPTKSFPLWTLTIYPKLCSQPLKDIHERSCLFALANDNSVKIGQIEWVDITVGDRYRHRYKGNTEMRWR